MDSLPEDTNCSPASQTEWDRIAATRHFKDLMATKRIFIVPAESKRSKREALDVNR